MGAAGRKQYMMLGGRPVLAHTVLAFDKCVAIEEIFLVIAAGDKSLCKEKVLGTLHPAKPVHLVSGGPTRQESVFNGLKATGGAFSLVAIHDGVRPLVRPEQIEETVEAAEEHGGCILALPATDTVKSVDQAGRVIETIDRNDLRLAQTPQTFRYSIILKAHMAAQKKAYAGTDDAELVERSGKAVKVIPGDPYNVKITTPEDLRLAEALLAYRKI